MPIFLATPFYQRDVDRRCQCGNCCTEWLESELHDIDDILDRLSPGEEVPAGQCPIHDCGALCHLIDEDRPDYQTRDKRNAARLLAALIDCLECLVNWVEIADDEDHRDYDGEAIEKARAAIKAATV